MYNRVFNILETFKLSYQITLLSFNNFFNVAKDPALIQSIFFILDEGISLFIDSKNMTLYDFMKGGSVRLRLYIDVWNSRIYFVLFYLIDRLIDN